MDLVMFSADGMSATSQARSSDWQQIVAAVTREYGQLSGPEKEWIATSLGEIEGLQQQLDALFVAAAGDDLCARCRGACCGCGHNHMTLVNLLSCLQRDDLPQPDFTRGCPFMGDCGCLLRAGSRPFNCVTFICDTIEEQMSLGQCDLFYSLERQLRTLYRAFTERYRGAAMTGLLLHYRRLRGDSFFSMKSDIKG